MAARPKKEEQMKEEKVFCPRCGKMGEKKEMLFLPRREDHPAQYWCYVCDYTICADNGEKKETD